MRAYAIAIIAGLLIGFAVMPGLATEPVYRGSQTFNDIEADNLTLTGDVVADMVTATSFYGGRFHGIFNAGTYNIGSASGVQVVDFNNGQIQYMTLTNTPTALVFVNTPSSGALFLTQDGTGGRTVVWPSGFKWPYGQAAVLTTTIAATDAVGFVYNGTTYKVIGIQYDLK